MEPRRWPLRIALACLLTAGCSSPSDAPRPLRMAVAASFAPTLAELVESYQAAHDVRVDTSVGSTGTLYAQIQNGAPFDLFFAADSERPRRLEAQGRTVSGSRFTYAVGRLALYAPRHDLAKGGETALRTIPFAFLSIANPELAPYGAAAQQVLESWGLWQSLTPRVVRGTNVAQALHFVESGAADVGLVAWPLVRTRGTTHTWLVPAALHAPIRQDVVHVRQAAQHAQAAAFLDHLRTNGARRILDRQGYAAP